MTDNKVNTASEITALLTAGTPESLTTTRAAAAGYILPLVDAGLPVIPLKPNSRLPALDHSWQRTPVTTGAWNTWLDQAFANGDGDGTTPVLGLGCRAGSVMIVADADTPGEVGALLSFLTAHGLPDASPTVKTPGTPDRAHHGGGHWWFILPPTIAVPAGLPGVLKVDSQGRTGGDTEGETFDLFLYSKQAALPPTVRDPGKYQLVGAVHELPSDMGTWLIDQGKAAREVQDQREARRAERAERRAAGELSESDAAREAWEDASPWSSILTPAGWRETGTDPHCGCSQWKHPEASSEKSATAHDCARGTYLQMWSSSCDDLGPGPWSKIQVNAALNLDGDVSAAMTAAGLPPKAQKHIEIPDLFKRQENTPMNDEQHLVQQLHSAVAGRPENVSDLVRQFGAEEVRERWDDFIEMGASGIEHTVKRKGRDLSTAVLSGATKYKYTSDNWSAVGRGMTFEELIDDTAPRPVHAGLFYEKGLHALFAPPGGGKTMLALTAAMPSSRFQWEGTSNDYGVYLDMDHNQRAKLYRRAVALGLSREDMMDDRLRIWDPANVTELDAILTAISAAKKLPKVIVVDSFTQLVSDAGLSTNSDADITYSLRRFADLATRTCVIILDHPGKMDQHKMRGSSAKHDAVDVAIGLIPDERVDKDKYPKTITKNDVFIAKDRHHGIIDHLATSKNVHDGGMWVLEHADGEVEVAGKDNIQRLNTKLIKAVELDAAAARRQAEHDDEHRRVVIDVIQGAGGAVEGKESLVNRVKDAGKLSLRTARAVVSAALDDKLLDESKTASNKAAIYSLAE